MPQEGLLLLGGAGAPLPSRIDGAHGGSGSTPQKGVLKKECLGPFYHALEKPSSGQETILEGKERQEVLSKLQALFTAEGGNPAGNLNKHFDVWAAAGVSKVVLDWIKNGVPVIWNDKGPPVSSGGRANYVPPQAISFVNATFTEYYLSGVIEESNGLGPGYVHPVGAVPKTPPPVTAWRIITNLTDGGFGPNAYMDKFPYKNENVDTLLSMIGPGWWGFTFDFRGGFHHHYIPEDSRRWYRFRWGGRLFQFCVMPFGPRHSPYFFCKTVREFIKILRRGCVIPGCNHKNCIFSVSPFGIVIVCFVDDFCVCAPTQEQALLARDHIVVPLMKKFGWIRNVEKGQFEPSQRFPFVGFVLDTVDRLVYLPEDKVEKYVDAIGKLLESSTTTPLEVARVAGKIISTMRAFAPALMFVRSSYDQISRYTSGASGWSSVISLTEEMRDDLLWVKNNLAKRNGRFMWRPAHLLILAADAAKHDGSGWGATLRVGERLYLAQGFWSELDLQLDIHILEILAIMFGMRAFRAQLQGRCFQAITDNSVCHRVLMRGSRKVDIRKLVRQVHDLECELDATMVDVMWIPSELNLIPDFLSRYVDVNDWILKPEKWAEIQRLWPRLDVDRFASDGNNKLPHYNTRWASPTSPHYNALAHNWKESFSYACPPLAMVGQVLRLIQEQGARAVVVVPQWEGQVWWRLVREMEVSRLFLGKGMEVFSPGRSGHCAPAKNPKWQFWAVEVDGNLCPAPK